MKKLFLSILALTVAAISSDAQIRFAPEAGLNLANMTFKDDSGAKSTSLKPGLTAGAIVEISFTDRLFLQPGVFYIMNGAKNSVGKGSITVHTIQVPVNVEYKTGSPDGTRFYVAAGPYVGLNLGGYITDSAGKKNHLIVSSDSGSYNIKPLDFGAGISVGVILASNFYARIRYQFGFANLEPGNTNNTVTTSGLGITIGYYFGKDKHDKKAAKKSKS